MADLALERSAVAIERLRDGLKRRREIFEEDKERNWDAAPVACVRIGRRRLYERDEMRREVFRHRTMLRRWATAGLLRVAEQEEDPVMFGLSVTEYAGTLEELAGATLLEMARAEREGRPWAGVGADPEAVLQHAEAALEHASGVLEALPWAVPLDQRRGLWSAITACRVAINWPRRRDPAWQAWEPTSEEARHYLGQGRLAQMTQAQAWGACTRVARDWGRLRLTPDIVELVHRLRMRLAYLSYRRYLVQDRCPLDLSGFYVSVGDARQVTRSFQLHCMGFFCDFERGLMAREAFLGGVKGVRMHEPVARGEEGVWRGWFRGIVEDREYGPIMTSYRKHFFDGLVQPGDVDIYRHSDTKQVIYGADIDTSSAIVPISVFNSIHAAEATDVMDRFSRTFAFVTTIDRRNRWAAECIDLAVQTVLRQVVSGHLELRLEEHLTAVDLCLREQPDPHDGPHGQPAIFRCLGEYFVWVRGQPSAWVAHSMMEAIRRWLLLVIEIDYRGCADAARRLCAQMYQSGAAYMFAEDQVADASETVLPAGSYCSMVDDA